MLSDDEDDSEGLGVVGFLSEQMRTEALFWRTVCSLKMPLSEVETWTLGEMRMASSYMEMVKDYKRIWNPYFEMKREM